MTEKQNVLSIQSHIDNIDADLKNLFEVVDIIEELRGTSDLPFVLVSNFQEPVSISVLLKSKIYNVVYNRAQSGRKFVFFLCYSDGYHADGYVLKDLPLNS